MVNTANENKARICVVRNQVYDRQIRKVLSVLKQLGDVTCVSLFSSYNPEGQHPKWVYGLPGGAMGEHLPHPLYTIRKFMGAEPTKVTALKQKNNLDVMLHNDTVRGYLHMTDSRIPYLINVCTTNESLIFNRDSNIIAKQKRRMGTGVKGILADHLTAIKDLTRNITTEGIDVTKAKIHSHKNPTENYKRSGMYTVIDKFINKNDSGINAEEALENTKVYEEVFREIGE